MDTIAGYKVSCVDGANPCIFVRADDVGIDGTILAPSSAFLQRLEMGRKMDSGGNCINGT